jgi:hypothetical protein
VVTSNDIGIDLFFNLKTWEAAPRIDKKKSSLLTQALTTDRNYKKRCPNQKFHFPPHPVYLACNNPWPSVPTLIDRHQERHLA